MKRIMNGFVVLIFASFCMSQFSYGQLSNGQAPIGMFIVTDQLNNYKWNAALRKKPEEIKPIYFFNENYLLADLTSPTGKVIARNKFRLDLKANSIYYLDSAKEQMEVMNQVKKITFTEQEGNAAPVVFEKGFPSAEKSDENNFYQVLVSGKASLLLDTKFAEIDRIEYPSGIPLKRTDKLVTYYGSTGAVTIRLAKTENLIELLSDKSKEIAAYIQRENIKLKKQSDLEKLFTYYNSLFQ